METAFTFPKIDDLPLQFQLSFRPFVAFLKAQQQQCTSSDGLYELYTYLINQFSAAVALQDAHEGQLDQTHLKELFQLATIAVLPLDHARQKIAYSFGLPVPLTIYHYSNAFEQLMDQSPDFLLTLPNQIRVQERQRFVYQIVLNKCYGLQISKDNGPSFRFQNKRDGLVKYYQLDINQSFMEPHFDRELPPLQQAWVDFVQHATPLPADVPPLPLDEFRFEGFSFFMMEDVTESETIQQLQDVFAHLHSDTEPIIYQRFESALRNLCGQPDLQIGLVSLPQVNGKFVYHPDAKTRSVFLRNTDMHLDGVEDPRAQQMITQLFSNPVPHIFSNLNGLPEVKRQVFHKQGIRSFMMYPISVANEVLGLLEMGSPHENGLNETVLARVEQIIPLIQEFLRYQLNQFNNNLEKLIRQKFTSLQPSVEWKFYEAAWRQLSRGQNESAGTETIPVRFPQVYPLYGAVDIRNSSVERHKAVHQDLANQLAAIDEIFSDANFPSSWDRPEQLREESYQCQHKLIAGLSPEDEPEMALFLDQEVNPYFRSLSSRHPSLEVLIQRYFAQVDPATGLFNQALKRYERSMDWLNVTVNEYIDAEEKKLQTVFPHYFERYRTDGTEYTIFVGQSIAPGFEFTQAVNRRLFHWQLTSMLEMAHLTHRLLPNLPLPLQTTQLILAHSQPVDISFRHDERRFDVEGSYSIRYEVLKKRIDKALIEGTQERLTQPDTIALVYSHSSEIAGYLPFITQMQESGQLKSNVEYLDLEPMQGVVHLKALRIHINYTDSTQA
ncbi:GAF domain-containing protein [Spirosoma foliorum]|uniref:GAF domain-containing protein n=1 Tax=Spirosoma foliorum TaxID=2710596 RepID=A0A7G5GP41_9BACT|nr:GAF domain-containing protein [Spirosoma foliorum]QMW00633.1 GAF domain-containing protein [Spirosoma foliorum]